jgi:hypothetical protein
LIFRGLNFSRNADIGQIGHLWMGTNSKIQNYFKKLLKPRKATGP